MSKGVLYVMTTCLDGVVKIGKSTRDSFEKRMSFLESNGYRNINGLKRAFAIEVEKHGEKEKLLHNVFSNSRLGTAELFSVDVNVIKPLLAAFEGTVIYSDSQSKDETIDTAIESIDSASIPDGRYTLTRKKKADGDKLVNAEVKIDQGIWTLQKDSILGVNEAPGVSNRAKEFRLKLKLDAEGRLLEDACLGKCTPSLAGVVVMNQACNGWAEWMDDNEKAIDCYRKKAIEEE